MADRWWPTALSSFSGDTAHYGNLAWLRITCLAHNVPAALGHAWPEKSLRNIKAK
jgi:hypothetical protein